ncbi:MAG: LPS export ABC transporter periplasmic protein LptC [Acidobacteriota bacterium]
MTPDAPKRAPKIARARSPYARLRPLLLVLGIALIAALGVLLAAYRFGQQATPAGMTTDGRAGDSDDPLRGEGFDFTQTSEGQPLFRIQAARSRQDREGNRHLEDVRLTVYRENEEPVDVVGRRAVFRPEERQARLDGDVQMRTGDLAVSAQAVELIRAGQSLGSVGPIAFQLGTRLVGRSSAMRVDFDADRLVLGGGVHVRNAPGTPPMRLDCLRLSYARDRGILRAFGDVWLTRGADEMRARQLTIRLQDDGETLRQILARWDVSATLGSRADAAGDPVRDGAATGDPADDAPADDDVVAGGGDALFIPPADPARVGGGSWTHLRGQRLVIDFDRTGQPARAELEAIEGLAARYLRDSVLAQMPIEETGDGEAGAGGEEGSADGDDAAPVIAASTRDPGVAVLRLSHSDGFAQALRARYILTTFVDGRPLGTQAWGEPLQLREQLDVEPPFLLRQVCAETLIASFQDGGLARLQLRERVAVLDRDLSLAGGDEALVDWTTGTLDVRGSTVTLRSARGEVLAPRITHRRDTGVTRARGGVRAVLISGTEALDRTPLGQGDEPLQVEAEEGAWTTTPQGFSFRGSVRAWRGANLLLADQLRGEPATGRGPARLTAGGGVRTIWTPPDRVDAPANTPRGPVEVVADRLAYQDDVGVLTYQDGVRVAAPADRSLRCTTLNVVLGLEGADAERFTCIDQVELRDPSADRTITGNRAVYEPAAAQIEVFGQPVKLRDGSGSEATGGYLHYDVDAGEVKLRRLPPDALPPPAPATDDAEPAVGSPAS